MINVENISIKENEILKHYSQEELMEYYLGIPLSSSFSSPFRVDDKPSCGLFYNANGKLLMKDWANYFLGSWIQVAGVYYGILPYDNSYTSDGDYKAILRLVYKDVIANKIERKEVTKVIPKSKEYLELFVETRDWTIADKEYWNPIPISMLQYYGCYAINKVYYGDILQPELTHSPSNPTYGFRYKYQPYSKWKIYKPLDNNGYKWRNTIPVNYVLGYDVNDITLYNNPKILTKSFKDALIMRLVTGKECYTYQSEIYIPDKLENNTIAVIYDNDVTGQKSANIIANTFDIKNIQFEGGKDPFNIVKRNNLKYLKEQWEYHKKMMK